MITELSVNGIIEHYLRASILCEISIFISMILKCNFLDKVEIV